jgi:hypothetical protein
MTIGMWEKDRMLQTGSRRADPMTDFNSLLNWRLLKGAHDFPGPDGGTCINEAAIIAAGFKYKKVDSVKDCPPCFSPVLSAYLLRANDGMPDDQRQKLMRFVMRLSGSADTCAVEDRRIELIVIRTVQKIVSRVMDARERPADAAACRAVVTFAEAKAVSDRLRAVADADAFAAVAYDAVAYATVAASYAAAAVAVAYATVAADAADAYARAAVWDDLISIAEEAFAIGNQAEALGDNRRAHGQGARSGVPVNERQNKAL